MQVGPRGSWEAGKPGPQHGYEVGVQTSSTTNYIPWHPSRGEPKLAINLGTSHFKNPSKLAAWKAKLLSKVGRMVLIKSVVNSLPATKQILLA